MPFLPLSLIIVKINYLAILGAKKIKALKKAPKMEPLLVFFLMSGEQSS